MHEQQVFTRLSEDDRIKAVRMVQARLKFRMRRAQACFSSSVMETTGPRRSVAVFWA